MIAYIHEAMKTDERIFFLTGDLGYSVLEKMEEEFPERLINVGVAEQNMMGVASGLAMTGKKVFVYSIIPFVTMRCFEQIRNDICFHNLDVTILGVGAGLSYGVLSNTHFALEDMAILRPLPHISIFSPADETEAILGITYLHKKHQGPVYFRIGKKKEPVIFEKPYYFQYGKGVRLSSGDDIVIFTTGVLCKNAQEAALQLQKTHRIASTIVHIHTVKPLDEAIILSSSKKKKAAFVVEEHGEIGGLGSAVAELLSEKGYPSPVKRIGIPNRYFPYTGSQQYLREKLGLTSSAIAATIASTLHL